MSKNVLFMSLSLCLLGALSQAVTTTILLQEGDELTFDRVKNGSGTIETLTKPITSLSHTTVNSSGGYGVSANTDGGSSDDYCHIWGTGGVSEPNVLRTGGVYPIPPGCSIPGFTQKWFRGTFGISDEDDVSYRADGGNHVYPPQGVWHNDTCLMVDTEPSVAFDGMYVRTVGDVELSDLGVTTWLGGYRDGQYLQFGPHNIAIFYDAADTVVLKGGDAIAGTGESLLENSYTLQYLDYSPDASHYIVAGQLTGSTANSGCLIINGSIAKTPDDQQIRERYLIPPVAGGLTGETWISFDDAVINDSGQWAARGVTHNSPLGPLGYVANNGVVRIRTGDIIDGVEIYDDWGGGDLGNLCINNSGDYAFSAAVDDDTDTAIFLNERLLIKTGDTVGDDLTLEDIRDADYMTMTDRDSEDIGKIYFVGNVSTDTPGVTNKAYIEIEVDMSLYFPDCDGNGQDDRVEIANDPSLDCNLNGYLDSCDIAGGRSQDCNSNGIPDECDIADGTSQDCNNNGIPDECDIADGTSQDCNENGIPDECDLADGTSQDCNSNGIPDECDIAAGTSNDINTNGIPDECEDDCNENGVPDDYDISTGTSLDCNNNGIPDECEPEPVPNLDFNLDRIVNMEDLAILAAAWLDDTVQTDVAPCGGDGITDTLDLAELGDHWLTTVYYFPDICKYAQAVPIGELFEGSTLGATATDDVNDITSCACDDFYDVWLTFTSEQAGLYQFDFAGKEQFPARLAVFASCGAGEIACYRPCQGTPVLNAAAQTDYYLRVAGAYQETGDYQLQIEYLGAVEPMTHDDCSQAVPLSIGDTFLSTTVGASGTDITSCACEDANDVWHTVTPAVTGYYVIDYAGIADMSDNVRASVWDGCPSGGSEVFCHQPCQGPAIVQLTASTTYYIRIAGAYSSTGIYSLTVEPAPIADDCIDAVAMQVDQVYFGTTTGTTVSTIGASCGMEDDIYDVWYSYTATDDEAVRIAISDYDSMGEPVLSVYDACGGNELGCTVAGGEGGGDAHIDMVLTATQTIYIRVSANYEQTGGFSISVSSLPDPPAFSDCANAVTVLLDTPYSNSNEGAFTTPGMDMYCGGYHDVWHSFTPAVSGDYAIEAMTQEAGCIVTIFDACNGTFLDCGWGTVNVSLTEGVAYKIAVAGESPNYETYTLTVTEDAGGGDN